MSTDADSTPVDPTHDDPAGGDPPSRPPVVAMVVVGVVMAATMVALLLSGRSATDALLDEGESLQPAGTATFDLGATTVRGELDTDWIRRERCPGWIQLNSMSGDATTLHLVATATAPDPELEQLVEVDDLSGWWRDHIGVEVANPSATTLLDTPALAGDLAATPGAPEEALLVACPTDEGDPGVGIRGPAGGFEQHVVVTTQPVADLGTVTIIGAAWVGGDLDLTTAEATRLAETLQRTEP